MKIAMAQMSMTNDRTKNLNRSLDYIRQAEHTDLLFFPEVQLTPFFAQYHAAELQDQTGLTVDDIVTSPEEDVLRRFRTAAADAGIYVSPNIYLRQEDGAYDTSLLIDPWGKVIGDAEMVHVVSAPHFYETEYYTPSRNGFEVFDTRFGKIGIVICFDRHLPESIRSCAAQGADLVIIPTANIKAEPIDVFRAELIAAAYQNTVCIAMCNRVGLEGDMDFAGHSLVVDCNGQILLEADDQEALLTCDIDLSCVEEARTARPYLDVRRPAMYH
jgi:predicted amidohydrolase